MDKAETSDGFSDWEQIQAPTPSGEQHMVAATSEDNRPRHQHDHLYPVFPPSRREGLEITSVEEEVRIPDDHLEANSSLASWSSSFLSTGDGANSGPLKKANEIGQILNTEIIKLDARVRYYMAFGCGVWSVVAVGGVVAAAVFPSMVYARGRRWRPTVIKEEKKERLIVLIQEKDQKINQLLVQIARMNELISADAGFQCFDSVDWPVSLPIDQTWRSF